jgi:hypothetical protein
VLSELHSMVLDSIVPEATSEGTVLREKKLSSATTEFARRTGAVEEKIPIVAMRRCVLRVHRLRPLRDFLLLSCFSSSFLRRYRPQTSRGGAELPRKNPRCSRGASSSASSSTASAAASPLLSCFFKSFGSPWYSPSSLCPLRKTKSLLHSLLPSNQDEADPASRLSEESFSPLSSRLQHFALFYPADEAVAKLASFNGGGKGGRDTCARRMSGKRQQVWIQTQ